MILKAFVLLNVWWIDLSVVFPPAYWRILFRVIQWWVRQYEKRLK